MQKGKLQMQIGSINCIICINLNGCFSAHFWRLCPSHSHWGCEMLLCHLVYAMHPSSKSLANHAHVPQQGHFHMSKHAKACIPFPAVFANYHQMPSSMGECHSYLQKHWKTGTSDRSSNAFSNRWWWLQTGWVFSPSHTVACISATYSPILSSTNILRLT